ncbi:MAG: alanine/ornithine racemase family PLP-dependent enzyme [Bacteroidales bacterium]|nr:alanine/ornithine racemase family PLP-dependent enzyme [Bacteroidales bacterium]
MAYLEIYKDKLEHNFLFLDKLFSQNNISWGVVSKILCGNKTYLRLLKDLGIREFHDSRLSNLRAIKRLDNEITTVYIKPPAKRIIPSLVKYADISFNTQLETIKLISFEAGRQNKTHKIIIMIEMGDLREGVMGENLVDFYSNVFELPNIEIIGLGTNLNCLNGIMPTVDKMIQLSLYKQLIEANFKKKIPWISGGSSVTIPMLLKRMIPKPINHFRIGETLFFGNNLITGKPLKGMKQGVFKLFAEIIELSEKPLVPIGEIGTNVAGESPEINENEYGKTSCRAILDIGLLDINTNHLFPSKPGLKFSGASSDMLVLDLGNNRHNYKVGDLISFDLSYMGALSVLNSDYIGKTVK